jgi:hypothetical protein
MGIPRLVASLVFVVSFVLSLTTKTTVFSFIPSSNTAPTVDKKLAMRLSLIQQICLRRGV